jgi:hypothetical protein
MALCLSPQQRQNCLRLRNAHLHKVRDIMQDRYRINDMMQSTLPSYDFELQAARQHLRALQVREPGTPQKGGVLYQADLLRQHVVES